MGKVVVFGSANMDLVTRVKRMPAPGETVLGDKFLTVFGGKGANEAVAAARLGAEVILVACVGRDDFGAQYLSHLASEGINTGLVRRHEALPTGCALIAVQSDGENSIIVCPGANSAVTPEHVRAASGALAAAGAALVQYEIPEDSVREVIRAANDMNVPVFLNVSPVPGRVDFAGGRVDYLIVNEVEAEVISGTEPVDESSLRQASAALHALGAATVVITRGADATFVSAPGLELLVPTLKVVPLDTVGAGDTFAGALAAGISEGMLLEEAVSFANRAAALATMQVGAQTSMPRREQVAELV